MWGKCNKEEQRKGGKKGEEGEKREVEVRGSRGGEREGRVQREGRGKELTTHRDV